MEHSDLQRKRSLTEWIARAKAIGFDEAAPLSVSTLKVNPMVRDMCAQDKCHAYDHNWTCPPAVGTLEECQARMHSYSLGILLQTVGTLNRTIDHRAYADTGRRHNEMFLALSDEMHREHPDALCLGAGGCLICRECAYPNPCRFPDRAVSSMEGYGLFVTQVCRDNQLLYYHGPKTITYSACILFNET